MSKIFPTVAVAMALLLAPPIQAQTIIVDGLFDDWQERKPIHADPTGDAGSDHETIDFGRLWIAHDADALYIRLELGREVGLQENGTGVYLDVDTNDDGAADISWDFSARKGSESLRTLGLAVAPTVTSDEFEIVISRAALGTAPKFSFSSGRKAGQGDRLPDKGSVVYNLNNALPPAQPIALGKQDPNHLRFLSYNTNNRLFEELRRAPYGRILAAVQPDVVVLQEIRSHTSQATIDYLAPLLPENETWYHERVGGEASVVLSPFPILQTHPLGDSGAFLLDTRERYGKPLVLIALSMPCCGNHKPRQKEVEQIQAFIQGVQKGDGPFSVPAQSPILLIGDANLVGPRSQQAALIAGPDWDGSPMIDLVPRHTHRPLTFTWFGRDYLPGRLDYAIYSDSVMTAGNHYVLFTPHMPAATRERHGLREDDVLVATDHLPLVADFEWGPSDTEAQAEADDSQAGVASRP